MILFVALLAILGISAFIIAGLFFIIYKIFENNNQKYIGKASATLGETKYKKDVTIYGSDLYRRCFPIKLKHYSKSKYNYVVNGKHYKLKYWEASTAKQMPRTLLVVYLKRFPKIAYVKNDISTNNYDIYAITTLMFGVLFIIFGITLGFKL